LLSVVFANATLLLIFQVTGFFHLPSGHHLVLVDCMGFGAVSLTISDYDISNYDQC